MVSRAYQSVTKHKYVSNNEVSREMLILMVMHVVLCQVEVDC